MDDIRLFPIVANNTPSCGHVLFHNFALSPLRPGPWGYCCPGISAIIHSFTPVFYTPPITNDSWDDSDIRDEKFTWQLYPWPVAGIKLYIWYKVNNCSLNSLTQQSYSKSTKRPSPLSCPCCQDIWFRVSMVIQITPKLNQLLLYHCRAFLNISLKLFHTLLSNGRISCWTVSMVIQIITKI